MASPFDDLDADVSETIEGAFGEAVRIIPRNNSRRGSKYVAAAETDPDRAPITIVGVPTFAAKISSTDGQQSGQVYRSAGRVFSGRNEVWVSAAEAARIGYEIETGDLVTLVGMEGEPTFAVANALPEGAGDIRILLTAEDQPS